MVDWLSFLQVTSQKVRGKTLDSGFRRNDESAQVPVIPAKAGIQGLGTGGHAPGLFEMLRILGEIGKRSVRDLAPTCAAGMHVACWGLNRTGSVLPVPGSRRV